MWGLEPRAKLQLVLEQSSHHVALACRIWHYRPVNRHVHAQIKRPTPAPSLTSVNTEPVAPTYRRAAPWLHKLLNSVCKRDWDDFPALPKTGPAILVGNHLSSLDALIVADYVIYHGRYPYFLGKSSLWHIPVLGRFLRAIGQIPVYRGTDHIADALIEARHRLEAGHVVLIFPEATTARDPLLWPFAGKTGTARLAMETGAPVIPFGHWGVSTVCPDNAGPQRTPHLLPRHWVCFRSGEPVDLSAFGCDTSNRDAVRAATAAIVDAIVPLVEQARGEEAPPLRWNPKLGEYVAPELAVW